MIYMSLAQGGGEQVVSLRIRPFAILPGSAGSPLRGNTLEESKILGALDGFFARGFSKKRPTVSMYIINYQ